MKGSQFPNKAPQPMPGNVRSALAKQKLMDAYRARPQYQQDDYLKWIATAVGPAAKQQRLDQMLTELQKGDAFKGEPWTAPAKTEPIRVKPVDTEAEKAAEASLQKASGQVGESSTAKQSASKNKDKTPPAKSGPAPKAPPTARAGATKPAKTTSK